MRRKSRHVEHIRQRAGCRIQHTQQIAGSRDDLWIWANRSTREPARHGQHGCASTGWAAHLRCFHGVSPYWRRMSFHRTPSAYRRLRLLSNPASPFASTSCHKGPEDARGDVMRSSGGRGRQRAQQAAPLPRVAGGRRRLPILPESEIRWRGWLPILPEFQILAEAVADSAGISNFGGGGCRFCRNFKFWLPILPEIANGRTRCAPTGPRVDGIPVEA